MAHPKLWGTTDTRNGLPTTTKESPDFSHGECQDKTKKAIWHKNRLFVLEAIYDQYTDEVEIRINSQYIIRKPRNKMSIIYAAIKTECESVCWDKGIDLSPIL